MENEGSIEIDRPIEEVFDYTVNNVAEWSNIVVSDDVIEEKPEGVGTTFRVVTEERGKRMEFDGVVTRHDPPHASDAIMRGKQFDITVRYVFEDLGEGRTRLTQWSRVDGKGFIKVMFFLFGWMMKKSGCDALDSELENLKRLIESREA